ncbi:hypothetical protein Ancab_021701 [Ancistrocladus abbreviatus]
MERSVNETKHVLSLEEKKPEEAVHVLPSNLMKSKSENTATRLRRQSDAEQQRQYSGPEVENERSGKGHLGQTQDDKPGHSVGLEGCSYGPCKGGVARLETDKSLAHHQKHRGHKLRGPRKVSASKKSRVLCSKFPLSVRTLVVNRNRGASTSKAEAAHISMTGGFIGDNGIQNMNRIFLEKKDCETKEEICKLGQCLGIVLNGDEDALIERLKSMEQRDRIAWEKMA